MLANRHALYCRLYRWHGPPLLPVGLGPELVAADVAHAPLASYLPECNRHTGPRVLPTPIVAADGEQYKYLNVGEWHHGAECNRHTGPRVLPTPIVAADGNALQS